MVNYYDLLGISQEASEDEIRAKLKEKKRIWTQRQNAPKFEQQQEASNNLRLIPEIESTLLDSQKRSAYDKELISIPKEEAHLDTSNVETENIVEEGWRLLSVGNVPDALMAATQAVKTQDDNPDAWALLGYCKDRWGESEEAIEDYKQAIKLKPNEASFYYDLGCIYEENDQWKDAMQQYQRAAQIDPSKTVYRATMGTLLIKNEMFQEGIELLEKCVEEEPDNEGYKYLLAVAYNDVVVEDFSPLYTKSGVRACCSEESAKKGIDFFTKALALKVSDDDLNSLLEQNLEHVKSALNKRWGLDVFSTIKQVAVALVIGFIIAAIIEAVIGGASGTVLGIIVLAGIIAGWIALNIVPEWKVNYNDSHKAVEDYRKAFNIK